MSRGPSFSPLCFFKCVFKGQEPSISDLMGVLLKQMTGTLTLGSENHKANLLMPLGIQ